MGFLSGFNQIKNVIGTFVGMSSDSQNSTSAAQPQGVIWARYTARLAILVMVLFIFIWWPVDSFDPEGFDSWSTRMGNLPDEVWYVLLGVILSWGTTEVMAARAAGRGSQAPSMPTEPDTYEGEDYMSEGRFDLVEKDDQEFFSGPAQPNPVIEDWRKNASG